MVTECRDPTCSERQAFGFVRNVFIIPHVIHGKGNWESAMAKGMARFPGLLGIGMDEGAAIVIHGDQCEVIGDSKVLLPDGSGANGDEELTAGARFDLPQAMKRMDVIVDAKTKTEIIDAMRKDLRESYVYPEMGDKLAAMLEEHHARGDYNSVTNTGEFIKLLNQQMSEIGHDPHLRVHYRAEAGEEMGPPPSPNYGFENTNIMLDGKIGYLKNA